MARRSRRPGDAGKDLKRALDRTLAEVLITTQSRLGSTAVSPYDTGRFRSSWMAAEGSPSSAVAPEGADAANTDATGLRVDSNRQYHLTNNLDYAEKIVSGQPGSVVSQPLTWFQDFLGSEMPRIVKAATKTVKAEEDL